MNVHVSYRLRKTPALEKDIQRHIEKLRKRLQVFRPELIHLKGALEENSPREGVTVSLNLRLPSGQMAVEVSASRARTAANRAFEDLLHQLGKHKDLLRASHKWRRRQNDAPRRRIAETPFEQTLAVTYPAQVSADDVRGYVNFNLARLQRFVEREIYFREVQDSLAADTLCPEEVIDETIVAALGDEEEKPERLALEPWLYRLALRSLGKLSRQDQSDRNAVHLEDSARPRNIKASDEPELQFHQPDETFTRESVIPDDRVATPEQILASDEMLHLIASALRNAGAESREAFILYAMEGFGIEEIVAITGRSADRVLSSISTARDHLRKAPGLAWEFRGRLAATGTG